MITGPDVEAAVGALVAREGGAPEGWADRLARHLSLLVEWNEKINLVSRRSVDRIMDAQLRPSLAPLLLLRPQSAVRVLDVGSGGGFPGIPLKVLRPHTRLDLVDATRKKCRFLEACVEALELDDTEVHWCRVEAPTVGLLARKPFDIVLTRAVGDPKAVSRAVCPLLSRDGEGWTFANPAEESAGRNWEDEKGSPLTCLRPLCPPHGP